MVSDIVLVAILGLIGTVGGSAIGYSISAWSKLQAAEKRIDAQDRQLDKRLEAQQQQLHERLDSQKEQLETQITAEHQRRRAEYALELEIDALIQLYEDTEECHSLLQDFAATASANVNAINTEDYEDEVRPKLREFRSSILQNGVFITEREEKDHFNRVLGQVRMANEEIDWRQKNPNQDVPEERRLDWKEFIDSFNDAKEFTRGKIRERLELLESD